MRFVDATEDLQQDSMLRVISDRQTAIIHIAKLVRHCRQSANLTQKEVAKLVQTQQSVISRLESPRNNNLPKLETLIDIVHACNRRLLIGFCKSAVL